MGGTSTDVSRFSGRYEHVFETTTAGVSIQAPQLDINTVAAGGGSMLFFRSGLYVVGPQSASAHPGPACYRKGGPLAVTDANLFLGRLVPETFPHIFGPKENEPLDPDASAQKFSLLTKEIREFMRGQDPAASEISADEVAYGFIKVANEAMCRPIRALTLAKGHDTKNHVLACFGGAGSQHGAKSHSLPFLPPFGSQPLFLSFVACEIARSLGIKRIFIHKLSSLLSAYGIALADVVQEHQEPTAIVFNAGDMKEINTKIEKLRAKCVADLASQGFEKSDIETEAFLNLRFEGTDFAMMIPGPHDPTVTFESAFVEQYKREFGFTLLGRKIFVDDIRVRGTGKTSHRPPTAHGGPRSPKPFLTTSAYFEGGRRQTKVFRLADLGPGDTIEGPAILLDEYSTILVEPNCVATSTPTGVSILVGSSGAATSVGTNLDPIQLSIFSHRFMSIAEQMGRTLQRTAISTNIKERLDFSCALFGPDGGLVANAPHIPVHLGAMQEAIRYQLANAENLEDGDVLVSNHPSAGGSHLPDITVMTPVFDHGKVVFFVASRGHHADIGGISPGSMPPLSKHLFEEGAAVKSYKLVRQGVFQEAGITEILMAPAQYPGCSGTRNLRDNLSDLKAQIAANNRGIGLVKELIADYGLDVVQAYMQHIQENAEIAVREMLREVKRKTAGAVLEAEDFMDDGTKIHLRVEIHDDGSAKFDFEGTGKQVEGNCNAPAAVTYSAIIYCLRSMVKNDIPLNQGCLRPITINIPQGTILRPSDAAAVVGGNVLTSQRVTDIILKAFGACAASQGCMNNLTFGDSTYGYYETICGGAGAGPHWHGRSGVHTHMTNCFPVADHEVLTRRGFMLYDDVLRALAVHGTLDIACLVDDTLEYHAIGREHVVVASGSFQHVNFDHLLEEGVKDGSQKAASRISLQPTSNHRMYCRMGNTIGKTAPDFAIHQAGAIVREGETTESTVVQLLTHFPLGKPTPLVTSELPFIEPLGLKTKDHVEAFLLLYGYWLSDGWLSLRSTAICFGPTKETDMDFLDSLFARLVDVLPREAAQKTRGGKRTVLHGVFIGGRPPLKPHTGRKSATTEESEQACYRIYSPRWWSYFADEYGHKYKEIAEEDAAEAEQYYGDSAAPNLTAAVFSSGCDSEPGAVMVPVFELEEAGEKRKVVPGITAAASLEKKPKVDPTAEAYTSYPDHLQTVSAVARVVAGDAKLGAPAMMLVGHREFRNVIDSDRPRVIFNVLNPTNTTFGRNAAGNRPAVAIKVLTIAMQMVGIDYTSGNLAIAELNPIVSTPSENKVTGSDARYRDVWSASLRASLGSGASVIVAFGEQVAARWREVESLVAGARILGDSHVRHATAEGQHVDRYQVQFEGRLVHIVETCHPASLEHNTLTRVSMALVLSAPLMRVGMLSPDHHEVLQYIPTLVANEFHRTSIIAPKVKSAKWFWYWVLRSLAADHLRLILRGLRFADGDESVDSPTGGQIGMSSIGFRDEVIQAAMEGGYSVDFWAHTSPGQEMNVTAREKEVIALHYHWKVSYTTQQHRVQPRLHVQTQVVSEKERRNGKVWCVSVPTREQLIVFRRVLQKDATGTMLSASRPTVVGNTRITDPEILERRYPVILRQFSLRPGSGGKGRFHGGDGVIRELEFRRPVRTLFLFSALPFCNFSFYCYYFVLPLVDGGFDPLRKTWKVRSLWTGGGWVWPAREEHLDRSRWQRN